MTTIHLRHGDCVEILATIPEGSVGAVVCDPPYGLEFMGKEWDNIGDVRKANRGTLTNMVNADGKPKFQTKAPAFDLSLSSQMAMQCWHVRWLSECYRALAPGGIIKAFSGSRTAHRLAAAMREAGFTDIRLEAWSYGSGFPKSLDVSKAIDKHGGVPQNVIRIKNILREAHRTSGRTLQELNEVCGFEASGYLRGSSTWTFVLPSQEKWVVLRDALSLPNTLDVSFAKAEREVLAQKKWSNSAAHFVPGADHTRRVQLNVTAPATDAARRWEGWGTALKPSWEPVLVGTKP